MTAKKVKFGIAGVGGMGGGHCNMLPNIPETELAAVCDTDPEALRIAMEKTGKPGFPDHVSLLESGLVEAVIIAAPHYFHPPIAVAAFERGIHVLSEKPLAVTVSGADAMIAAAKKSGCKFGVMYQMRSEPQNLAAKSIVASGQLGEIYRTSLFTAWYRSQAYYNSGGWRATWDGEGGGVLINQAPHFLDLFTWLGGLPERLTGGVRTHLHDIEVEDEAFAVLEYAGGAHGYLYASTTEIPERNLIEICGDRGKIVLEKGALKHYKVDGSIREFTHENREMWASPKSSEAAVELPAAGELKGHSAITQNFARAILYNEPLLAPGEEGLNAVELINGIILSGKTEKPVPLPVDRQAYDQLIAELRASSKTKKESTLQRVMDPKFA